MSSTKNTFVVVKAKFKNLVLAVVAVASLSPEARNAAWSLSLFNLQWSSPRALKPSRKVVNTTESPTRHDIRKRFLERNKFEYSDPPFGDEKKELGKEDRGEMTTSAGR
ncbi:hypothetical protein B0J14DRAFT_646349 [Halenospora varia]|nr:hypothetical protein B0J14DRAFT_646349 [Halenospora varia]